MDWVMSPSSGDALLCFVKRAVPERTKEKTGTAKAMAVVVGLSLRRMVNLTTRCPQRGKSNPAILTAAPFRGLPQRREHLASYGTTLCRGSINALIVAPWSLPRRQTESPRWLGVLSASSLTCTFRLPGLFARARSGLSPLTSPDR